MAISLNPSVVTSGTFTFTDPPPPPTYPKWFTGLDVAGVTVVIGSAWQPATGLSEFDVVNLLLCTNAPFTNPDGSRRRIYFNETGDYFDEPNDTTNRLRLQWYLFPNDTTITTSANFSYISLNVSAGYYDITSASTTWEDGWYIYGNTGNPDVYTFQKFFNNSGSYSTSGASSWMLTTPYPTFDGDIFTAMEPYSG